MDGENNGKPYEQMDDLGVFPYFWKHPYLSVVKSSVFFFVIFPCMSLFQFWDVLGHSGITGRVLLCIWGMPFKWLEFYDIGALVLSFECFGISCPLQVGSAKAIDVIYLQREVEWLQQVPWLFVILRIPVEGS